VTAGVRKGSSMEVAAAGRSLGRRPPAASAARAGVPTPAGEGHDRAALVIPGGH
jgi:hypothetical protein